MSQILDYKTVAMLIRKLSQIPRPVWYSETATTSGGEAGVTRSAAGPAVLFFSPQGLLQKRLKGCECQAPVENRTACRGAREPSDKRMGCDSARCLRRAKAMMIMIRAISTKLFHAFFWLTGCTCRDAKSFTREVSQFPMITCGNNVWISGLSQIKAAWVRQALCFGCETFSCGCSKGSPLCLLETMFPFPPLWNKDTEVSSRLMRSGCLPEGARAAQLLYHWHFAWACFLVSGARKVRPFFGLGI